MTAAQVVVEQAEADGVTLHLSGDAVRAKGEPEAVSRWLPILRERKGDIKAALAEKQCNALATVKASGARLVTHRHHRVVVVSTDQDSPELRAALVTLGYGPCEVRHLDTVPYRGRDAADVAAALDGGQ